MANLIMESGVRKVSGCPHYVTAGYYADMLEVVGRAGEATIRCAGCYERPVGPLGRVRVSVPEVRSRGQALLDARERLLHRRVA